jgi:hypothetical protein
MTNLSQAVMLTMPFTVAVRYLHTIRAEWPATVLLLLSGLAAGLAGCIVTVLLDAPTAYRRCGTL